MTLPVTIIIPAYCTSLLNVVWFEECVQSALETGAQVVVWDDGSPLKHKVFDVCRTYDKVRFSGSVMNHGPSYVRNRAVELADTELIFPLDCDDTVTVNAISVLYDAWLQQPGTPVFPDLYKVWGDGKRKYHRLVDWSCQAQQQIIGIASVNVLHSKQQWADVGGWDEAFTANDLYEDSEYNARLLGKYCARNVHQPLVNYRQHDNSRLAERKALAGVAAGNMLQRIRRYDMACCGKKAKTVSVAQSVALGGQMTMVPTNLPETDDGKILVQYVGGQGKARHTYRGPGTHIPYQVVYGAYLYVDAVDATEPGGSNSYFVRKQQPSQAAEAVAPKPVLKKVEAAPSEPIEVAEDIQHRTSRANAPKRKSVK